MNLIDDGFSPGRIFIYLIVIFPAYFLILGTDFVKESKGCRIRVTANAVTGRAVRKNVNLPISSITSVTTGADNSIVINSTKRKKPYIFKGIPNCSQIYKEINSQISSR